MSNTQRIIDVILREFSTLSVDEQQEVIEELIHRNKLGEALMTDVKKRAGHGTMTTSKSGEVDEQQPSRPYDFDSSPYDFDSAARRAADAVYAAFGVLPKKHNAAKNLAKST
ncbi:hypothetical protein [Hahella chejuensis]|uniref:hypothetical protein n=1 Tax=Hahella chejuensis TaxID=158327 RepID=UPI0005A11939|nr:hypothetical protein [Hahella chejuensis]